MSPGHKVTLWAAVITAVGAIIAAGVSVVFAPSPAASSGGTAGPPTAATVAVSPATTTTQPTSSPASADIPQPTTTPSSPEAAVLGTWKGTYGCATGPIGLQLSIGEDQQRGLWATFTFYPVPTNPGIPYGKFAMKGAYVDGTLELQPDHWISTAPSGWTTVSLVASGPTGTPPRLTGTVDSCDNFSVTKESDAPPTDSP